MYFKVISLSDPQTVRLIRDLFPNTSFPQTGPNAEFLAEHGLKLCLDNKIHDPLTEKLVQCEPYVDGEFAYAVKIEPYTAEELEALRQGALQNVRQARNNLLKDCDWTQLPDAPSALKAEWATYRQALRDITNNVVDPRVDTVNWPKKPTDPTE